MVLGPSKPIATAHRGLWSWRNGQAGAVDEASTPETRLPWESEQPRNALAFMAAQETSPTGMAARQAGGQHRGWGSYRHPRRWGFCIEIDYSYD